MGPALLNFCNGVGVACAAESRDAVNEHRACNGIAVHGGGTEVIRRDNGIPDLYEAGVILAVGVISLLYDAADGLARRVINTNAVDIDLVAVVACLIEYLGVFRCHCDLISAVIEGGIADGDADNGDLIEPALLAVGNEPAVCKRRTVLLLIGVNYAVYNDYGLILVNIYRGARLIFALIERGVVDGNAVNGARRADGGGRGLGSGVKIELTVGIAVIGIDYVGLVEGIIKPLDLDKDCTCLVARDAEEIEAAAAEGEACGRLLAYRACVKSCDPCSVERIGLAAVVISGIVAVDIVCVEARNR